MEKLISFLQINLFLVVFYCFYWLFLRKETFHKLNRFYLVVGSILAIILPIIKFDFSKEIKSSNTEFETNAVQYFYDVEEVILQDLTTSFTYLEFFQYVYFCGVVISFLIFVLKLKKSVLVIKTIKNERGTAFSFFGKIFIDKDLDNQDTIFSHEKAHNNQFHCFDLVLFEVLKIVFWMNPAIYFYYKSVLLVHEYLADDSASEFIEDKKLYATILVGSQFNVQPETIFTHHFFNDSNLKKRVIMLIKNPSKRVAFLKFGLLAPLFFGMVLMCSFTIAKKSNLKVLLEKIETPIARITPKVKLSQVEYINDQNKKVFVEEPTEETVNPITNEHLDFSPSPDNESFDLDFPLVQKDTVPKNVRQVFNVADKNPEFLGGIVELYRYVSKNLVYPELAYESKMGGRVYLRFVVEKDGSISNVEVLKGIGMGCDEEATRVIKNMPRWNPGYTNGEAVAVRYNMPVVFTYKKRKKSKRVAMVESNKTKNLEEEKMDFTQLKLKKADDFSIGQPNTTTQNKVANGFVGNPYVLQNNLYFKDFRMNPSKNYPLFIVDGKEQLDISAINPRNILELSVSKNPDLLKPLGEKAKYGIVYITTKKN